MELSGGAFNKRFPFNFYKVTNKEEIHYGLQYKTGLNIDPVEFNPNGECKAGGIYFTDEKHIHIFLDYGPNIRKVTIPDNARVYIEKSKYKADRIILSSRISRTELEKIYLEAVKQNGNLLQHIPEEVKTYEMCLTAVNNSVAADVNIKQ